VIQLGPFDAMRSELYGSLNVFKCLCLTMDIWLVCLFLRIGSAGIKVGIGNVTIYYQLTARTVIGGGVYCGIFSNSSVYGSLELSVSCIQPPVCI
jgi:hypothetical protein